MMEFKHGRFAVKQLFLHVMIPSVFSYLGNSPTNISLPYFFPISSHGPPSMKPAGKNMNLNTTRVRLHYKNGTKHQPATESQGRK